jgi:hypothetical protein
MVGSMIILPGFLPNGNDGEIRLNLSRIEAYHAENANGIETVMVWMTSGNNLYLRMTIEEFDAIYSQYQDRVMLVLK